MNKTTVKTMMVTRQVRSGSPVLFFMACYLTVI
jgi:hypothetical protein